MVAWPRLVLWRAQAAWIRFHGRFLCRHPRLRQIRPNGEVFCLRCGLSWRRDTINPSILEASRKGVA